MVSDDERREVAERLREKSRKYARELSSSHTSINAYHEVREVLYGTDGAPKSLCEFFDRLADLIDPREALLALADEMYGRLDEYDVGLHGGIYMANEMRKYARRIREILGVSDD